MLNLLLVSGKRGAISRKPHFSGSRQRSHLRGYVLRQINENRPRTACARQIESLMHNAGELAGVTYDVVVFCAWPGDADRIDFLKCIRPNHLEWNLPRYDDQGSGVHICVCNTSNGIGCTGAGSYNGNTNFAAGTAVSLGHVDGALLMPRQNMTQAWLNLWQFIVDVKYRSTGITKDCVNPLSNQCLQQDAGPTHGLR